MLVVTGAAGFVGGHVLHQAARHGRSVVTVDRRNAARRPIDLVVDLAEPGDRRSELVDVLGSAAAVIHLAGCAGARDEGAEVAQRRHRDNVLAARTVLSLTPAAIPIVVTSSSSVYGGSRAGRRNHEDDNLRPMGGYAESKLAVERDCGVRAARGGRVTVVRPFTVVGHGQRFDMALSRWVAQAVAGRPLTVFGDLRRSRDLSAAEDVAIALVRLAETAPPTTVNLGSGTCVTLQAMTDAVARLVERTGVEQLAASPAEPDSTLADVSRAQELLGFAPRSPDLDATVVAIAADLAGAGTPTPLGVRV